MRGERERGVGRVGGQELGAEFGQVDLGAVGAAVGVWGLLQNAQGGRWGGQVS